MGKDKFYQNLDESRKTLDKELLVLSTTALGFSVYFVNIIGISVAAYYELLVASWWCFGLAIVSVLLSHGTSERHNHLAYNYRNTKPTKRTNEMYKQTMRWNSCTTVFNCVSLFLICFGIIVFLTYATLTFSVSMNNSNSRQEETKAPPPAASSKQDTIKGLVTPSSALKPPAPTQKSK